MSADVLERLGQVIAARRGGDAEKSYVARLLARGEDAILKKIGEEATETVMAAKDGDRSRIVAEFADLWFHSLIALEHYGLSAADVLAELARREGLSGLDEKAARPDRGQAPTQRKSMSDGLTMTQTPHTDPDCLFCKIVAGRVPSRKVYEDDELFVFHDINPAAPVHFLMVPKHHIESLAHAHARHELLLGRMLLLASNLALEQGCNPGTAGGFRVVVNNGREGGQEVLHLHLHVMGGPRPWKRG